MIKVSQQDLDRFKEIMKLYNVNEAEEQLVYHLMVMIRMLGYSKELTKKLLNVCAALHDIDWSSNK